jgi:hypothetical protein
MYRVSLSGGNMTGGNQTREDTTGKEFTEGLYYMITRMTSALYIKDTLRRWYRDDGKNNNRLWFGYSE